MLGLLTHILSVYHRMGPVNVAAEFEQGMIEAIDYKISLVEDQLGLFEASR